MSVDTPDLSVLDALGGGFVDPAAPGQIPAALRGEAGLTLMTWLLSGGVTASDMLDVAAAFRAQGDRFEGNLAGLKGLLPTLIYQMGLERTPRLATFLQEGLHRVSDAGQWEGMLAYLRFLAQAMAMATQSGPIPER